MIADIIFRRLSIFAAVGAIGGCAQLPTVSSGNAVDTPSVRAMPQCGVSVQFSGLPVPLPKGEVEQMKKVFGEYAKWEVSGWVLTSPSLSLGTTYPNEINSLGDFFGVYGTTFV